MVPMRKLLQLALIAVMISSLTFAETSALTPQTSTTSGEVAAGTQIHATLDSRISTDTSKVGDTFTATISDPVRASNGGIAIPAGAKVRGEVTEVEKGKTLGTVRGAKA